VLIGRALAGAVALLITSGIAPAVAFAQESRTVHARMTFHAEAREIRTSACLQLVERTYPSTRWWETTEGPADAADRAFKAVIAAITKKDRAALLRLTDASQTRDTAKFDSQANAFFQQFGRIRLVEVPRAFELDDIVVFFGRFQSDTQTALIPLMFAYQGEGSFGFLPMRSNKVTLELVNDWFASRSNDLKDTPMYCSDAEIARATHRVELVRAQFKPSALLLTGVSLEGSAPVSGVAKQVAARIEQMKASLKAEKMDAFYTAMTPEGAGRLRQWMATATAPEREGYITAFLQQEPFFIFDQGPLIVVYVRIRPTDAKPRASGGPGVAMQAPSIQAIYFTTGMLWTNSSHITVADKVFKDGPVAAASGQKPPFGSLVRK
jgi:hypothetical protein